MQPPALQPFGKPLLSLLHAKRWLSLKAGLLASVAGFGLQLVPAPIQAQAESKPQPIAHQHLAVTPRPQSQAELVKTVVSETALRYAVPRRIALGLSGHESGGWRMWESDSGEVLHNQNPAVGDRQASTDWGVMQINDLAHPEAFPQARQDLRFNVDYGLRYLAELHQIYRGSLNQGFGDWDVTLAAYPGEGHSFGAQFEASMERSERFLRQQLR